MLPAYFANMAPVIVKNFLKKLALPLDFNKTWRGKPIFGSNKTFRGIIFAVIFGVAIAYFQFLLYNNFDYFKSISFIDYSEWFLFGFLMGFGAIFGDLIESFIKRRVNVAPGSKFFPWDQIDFVIGALLFSSFFFIAGWKIVITILIISILGHIIINHAAYYLKIRGEKW